MIWDSRVVKESKMNLFKKAVISTVAGMTLAGCLGGITSQVDAAKGHKTRVTRVTEKQINNYIKKASLKQKIGQMYVSRTPQQPGVAEHDAYKYNLGGFIVYDADLQNYTTNQFKTKMASYQNAERIPLLIGIDQEGGLVSRLTHSGLIPQNGDQFKFARDQYENAEKTQKGSGMKAVTKYAHDTATLLRSLGVNWNYAPDADYSDNPKSFIYQRGFGGVMGKQSYQGEANYISQVIPAWQHDNLIAATLKHFPGYGDAADTHTGFAHTDKSKADIESKDMLSFKAGIKAGADSVMVTHVIYDDIDPEYPASLSKKINTLLRKDCNFKGVIVTDALEMGAIKDFAKQHGNAPVDVLAVKAGNDMIMTTDYATGIPEIAAAVKKGEISKTQINNSVRRILNMKNKLHLLKPSSLSLKKQNKRIFTLKDVAYNRKDKAAVIAGTAKKGTHLSLKNTDTKKVVKKIKVGKSGNFKITLSVKEDPQNFALVGKGYVSVNVHVQSDKVAFPVLKKFTLNAVTYNSDHRIATISGKIPDAGEEGSLTMSFLNAATNKAVGSAVVGKDGNFSSTVRVLDKDQQIKVVAQNNKDYEAQTVTVKAK